MLLVVKDEELTEDKKEEIYKYRGFFKIINRIGKLIQDVEELEQYISYSDQAYIRKEIVKQINTILDSIDAHIDYARFEKEQIKLERLIKKS